MLSLRFAARVGVLAGNDFVRNIERSQYSWVLGKVLKDRTFLQQCKDAGLTKSMIARTVESFENDLVYRQDGTNLDALKVQYVLGSISRSDAVHSSLFPLFLKYAKSKIPNLGKHKQLKEICNLSNPAQWYPEARSLERSIVFHAGPTNSGKTHAALEKFLAANSGIYCCPLRLLAREISQRSTAKNVLCSLVTGEEKRLKNGGHHVACTVEMADLRQKYEVAVIDEIQIIAHEERGWAWTQALLGLQAKEIHVCGEPRAISIVRKLCEQCNDNFEIREYERLTKLRVKKYAVGSVKKLRVGDCVVCFKRRDIYKTVSQLKQNGQETAMIYGKLPPHTKRKEAQKFNNTSNDCNILVATDAIGMGLNLNIKRIVFKSLEKGVKDEDGDIVNTPLTTPEVLQVAGRAGRYGFQESGEVTTLHEEDIANLHKLLLNPKEEITHARILPMRDHYVKFSQNCHSDNFFKILTEFRKLCRVNENIFELCSQRDPLNLAEMIQKFKLPLRDALVFSLCPINPDSKISSAFFLKFAKCHSQLKPVKYNDITNMLMKFHVKIPFFPEILQDKIATLEDVHNILSCYLWLNQRFFDYFPDAKKVSELRTNAGNAISMSIHNIRNRPSLLDVKIFNRKMKKHRQQLKPVIHYKYR